MNNKFKDQMFETKVIENNQETQEKQLNEKLESQDKKLNEKLDIQDKKLEELDKKMGEIKNLLIDMMNKNSGLDPDFSFKNQSYL